MAEFKLDKEVDGVISLKIIEKQRSDLINLLDLATNSWIEFMKKVGQYMGSATVGRPSKESIEKSMLGAYGFKKWPDMIEADRKNGGLGWKHSTWQQWQKAYKVIKRYPELANRNHTPHEINQLENLAKETAIAKGESTLRGKAEKPIAIPQKTLAQWDEAIAAAQERKVKAKAEHDDNLKKELTEASQKLSKTISELDKQSVELQSEKRLNANLEAQIAELREQARVNNENLNLLTKNAANLTDDLKRTAGERNKARETVVNNTKKLSEQDQSLKVKVAEVKILTDSLNALKNRSLINRILNN